MAPPGPNYERGMALLGKYVLIGEGVRGSLAKQLIAKFELDKSSDPAKSSASASKSCGKSIPKSNRQGLVQALISAGLSTG